MKTSHRRYVQDVFSREGLFDQESGAEVIHLLGMLSQTPVQSPQIAGLNHEDRRKLLQISARLFRRPTGFSRDLAQELALERGDLVRLYRVIRNISQIQDLMTLASPQRRRISFLRKELLPGNVPRLKSMFSGDNCPPTHVEFHPALMCNLRCRACPNCQPDSRGERQFLGYPKLGEPLNGDRLRLIQDMFLDLGLESFSFGGGGEPSLSGLTLAGIAHLRDRSDRAEISLYTNGIFPDSWAEGEFQTLVKCLTKMRFSIDASNAQEWSQYKGRPPEFFEILWKNIERVVAARRQTAGTIRIGASCLVSGFAYKNLETFLTRAKNAGLDFCDIKEVETCFGEKADFKVRVPEFSDYLDDLLSKINNGFYAPMDVVVDDRLLLQDDGGEMEDYLPARCWIAIRGRMLTVGPYGELHPCSDAANPGSQTRKALKNSIGQLTAFDSLSSLGSQFTSLWADSLPWRTSLSRANCAYCVPSHRNYNLAVERIYEDWKFGIMPEDQPFAAEMDHYSASRGARGG